MNQNSRKFFVHKDKNIHEKLCYCFSSFGKIEKAFFPTPNNQIKSKSFIDNLEKNLKAKFTWSLEDHKKSKMEINYSKSLMKDIHILNTMSMTDFHTDKIKDKHLAISSSFFRKNAQNIPSSYKNLAKTVTPEICIPKNFTFKDSSSSPNFKQDSFSSMFKSTNNLVYNSGNSASNKFIKFNFLDSFSKKYQKNMDQKPSNCLTENSGKISVFSFEKERSPFNLIKHKFNNEFYNSYEDKILSSKRERSIKKVVQGLNSPRNKISFFGNFKFTNEDSLYNDETQVKRLLKKKRRLHLKNQQRKTYIKRETILYYEPLELEAKDSMVHGSLFIILDLEKSFDSEDEAEIQYVNPDLKHKFFKYFNFDKALHEDKICFGKNPLSHYKNLKELFILLSEKAETSSSSSKSELNEIENIKYSIKFLSDHISRLPVFKPPSYKKNPDQESAKTNIDYNSKHYQCRFCEEIFEKPESLGGHTKLHSNFK